MNTHGCIARMRLMAAVAVVFAAVTLGDHALCEEAPAAPPGPPGARELVEQVRPSVVGVDAYQTIPKGLWVHTRDFFNPFPLRSFVGDTLAFVFYIPRAILYPFSSHRSGSGFLVDTEGHVLTSFHVIDDYNVFTVRLFDGSVHEAEVAGRDDLGDIALLKIDISELADAVYPVKMGDSDKVRPGDGVVVIGNPLGLEATVTMGVVSGVGRRVGATALDDMLQVDAALDAGNSGGPVFNSNGEVIGIAAAQFFLAENKGFAVPINMATSVLDDLKTGGYPRRGRIGVVVENPTVVFARARNLPKPAGALVVSVAGGSPAQEAGIRPGDLILECGGKEVKDSLDLVRFIRRTKPGDTTTLKALRAEQAVVPTKPPEEGQAEHIINVRPVMIKSTFQVF